MLPNLDKVVRNSNGQSEVQYFGPTEVFMLPLGIADCSAPQKIIILMMNKDFEDTILMKKEGESAHNFLKSWEIL